MKSIVFVFLAMTLTPAAWGTQTLYYSGTETQFSLQENGKEVTQQILLKKSIDENLGVLTELACLKEENAPATLSPVYMKVSDNEITQISDSPNFSIGILSGNGQLEGTAWDWNYLKFSMKYTLKGGQLSIQDENWVSGPYLIAIKNLFWEGAPDPGPTHVGVVTARLKLIDAAEYATEQQALGCPN